MKGTNRENFVVMVELILPFRLGLCPKRLLYPEASPMSQARRLGLPPTPHIITYTVPDAALAVDTKIIATFAHPIPPSPPSHAIACGGCYMLTKPEAGPREGRLRATENRLLQAGDGGGARWMGSSRGYFIIILVPMEGLTDEHLGLGDKLVGGDFHVEGGGALADAAYSKPAEKVFRVRCPMLKRRVE